MPTLPVWGYTARHPVRLTFILFENRKRVHPLDCLVLNMVCDYAAQRKRPYDVIRGAFPEGDPIFPGSMLLAKTHIQLCVRNPAKIVRLFRA